MSDPETTTQSTPWRAEDATPLGVHATDDFSTFAVFAEAEAARVRLTDPGTRRTMVRELEPVEGEPGVWRTRVEEDVRGWTYSIEIERDGKILADIVDPWARLVRQGRGYVCFDDTEVTARPALDPRDAIIYELHVRDFTRDRACGVKPGWRGKYLGLAQAGTRLEGMEISTGLDHIAELGVNTIQLMPVHAFAMPYDPEYEWGYMPLFFNAPEATYAASVELEAPVREFKRLVSAIHERGMRVTLDVVYNHTAERWPDRLRSLMALAPREYFRWKGEDEPWDGSACGNEFRSESPQGRRFIVESVRYWVEHFGVDGFRFDLMGLIDAETMGIIASELHAIDPTILVYGEPWAGGPAGIEINGKGAQRGRGWGVFNDDMRDGLRGSVFEVSDFGFLNGGTNIEGVKDGGGGGTRSFAESPLECVNYVECHDNHTLEDRLRLTHEKARLEDRSEEAHDRMSRLAMLALMTSQGIPFLHAGQEFGRTKDGEDNTYNLGDVVNNIRWAHKDENFRRFQYHKDAIAMRKGHPMFRLTEKADIDKAIRFFDDDLGIELPEGTIAFQVKDVTGADSWERALVLLNGSHEERDFPLPALSGGGSEGEWTVCSTCGSFDGRLAGGKTHATGQHTVGAHSGAVLYVPRE